MNLKLLSTRAIRMAPDRVVSTLDSLRGFPRWTNKIPFGVPADPEPPFFIVGCGRSGNTLLRNLLCRDYDVCIPPEIPGLGNTIRRFTQSRGQPWPLVVDRVLDAFAKNANADRSFAATGVVYNLQNELGIDYAGVRQELLGLPAGQRSLARILVGIYRNYASRDDENAESRIGDKTPWNSFHVGRIAQAFPFARYVHMVRDPRATVASYMSNFNGIQQMTCDAGIARWVDSNRKLMAFARQHPTAVRVMRYEDLVADPQVSVASVAGFLGLAARARPRDVLHGDRMLPHYAKSFQKVASDSLHKWRDILDQAQVAEVERACAPIMRLFGYDGSGGAAHA